MKLRDWQMRYRNTVSGTNYVLRESMRRVSVIIGCSFLHMSYIAVFCALVTYAIYDFSLCRSPCDAAKWVVQVSKFRHCNLNHESSTVVLHHILNHLR